MSNRIDLNKDVLAKPRRRDGARRRIRISALTVGLIVFALVGWALAFELFYLIARA